MFKISLFGDLSRAKSQSFSGLCPASLVGVPGMSVGNGMSFAA